MPKLHPHPPDQILDAFLLGKLPDAEYAEVESHIVDCPSCQARAAASRVGDTLVELLAATGTKADRPAAPTPTLTWASTPAQYASDQEWDAPAREAEPPEVLAAHPKYRVFRCLGAGGMGTVWLAEHTVMNRPVAVKVIRTDLLAKPGATARFQREVRAAARLHHPNIVTAYDAEPAGDSCLLVMEYVEGETLGEQVKAGPLPVAEACRAACDAARGLAHAHAAGLVHRDVKPHNLIRAADGTVKVLDFGLAGVAAGEAVAAAGDGLTGAGMVAGTPDYIAPEQIADPHTADARSDIYGLGCTLYHLLAGRVPFASVTVAEKLAAQESRMPDPIPDLVPDIAAVLAKMLAKHPEDRYQTADEVVSALETVIAGAGRGAQKAEVEARRPRGRAWTVAAALLALVAVAAAVIFKVQRDNQEITIETDDPDIEVAMKRKGEVVRVIDRKSGQVWDLDTTTNQIDLANTPGGLTLTLPEGTAVVMKRKGEQDGKPVFSVTRTAKPNDADKLCAVRAFDGDEKDAVWSVAFSPDGKRVLKGGGTHVVLYDRATGENVVSIRHGCWSAVTSPDGKQILTATHGGTLHLWDAATGEQLKLNAPQLGRARSAVFSADGKLIASSHADGFVHLCDPVTGEEVQKFPAFHHAVRSAAFTPKGDQILVVRGNNSESDKTLCLYDVKTGAEVRTFEGHTDAIFDVTMSADGRRALSCGRDKTVRLWDVATGKQLLSLEGHTAAVAAVAVCPGERHAVSGGLDKVVRLWDLEIGKEVRSFEGHTGDVISVAVSSDGRFAASGSCVDKTVRLWRLPAAPAAKP